MKSKEKSYSGALAPIGLVLFLLIIASATASAAASVSKPPVADFSVSPTSGAAPLKVTFTDKSSGLPTSYLWNFGDNDYSTNKNTIHTYYNSGKYAVTLTVKNYKGVSTKTKYITVSSSKNPEVKILYSLKTANRLQNINGIAKNIPKGSELQIYVYAYPVNKYYPQNNMMTFKNGIWSTSVYIGDYNTPAGTKYDIIAVLANQKAQKEFDDYFEMCNKLHDWSIGMASIPEGAVEYDRITVTRA